MTVIDCCAKINNHVKDIDFQTEQLSTLLCHDFSKCYKISNKTLKKFVMYFWFFGDVQ